jgi:hypothetical protein
MPIYEFKCPVHGKFERYSSRPLETEMCPQKTMIRSAMEGERSDYYFQYCHQVCRLVEFSVPAKRNPRYGEG